MIFLLTNDHRFRRSSFFLLPPIMQQEGDGIKAIPFSSNNLHLIDTFDSRNKRIRKIF